MAQLHIQRLREEYQAIDNMLDTCWKSDDVIATSENIKAAYHALDSILKRLLAVRSLDYKIEDANEMAHNWVLDMRYVTGALSEPEMREREKWHWEQRQRLENEHKQPS